jgi:hypothetical protein
MSQGDSHPSTPRAVFEDPVVQLAALCTICALAALSPQAALAALSPTLRPFNPAINPNAALLSFANSLQGTTPAPIPMSVHDRNRLIAWALLLHSLRR